MAEKFLYFNGRSAANNSSEWLYCEDGKIRKMGRGSAPTGLGKDVSAIDLQGGYVLPGLIDSHIHIHAVGEQKQQINLRDCRSADELLKTVITYRERNPGISAIRGYGWDESKWTNLVLPSLMQLDSVSQECSLLLSKVDGHAGFANSKVLQQAGITPDSRMEGGWVGVTDGKLNGLVKEKAYEKTMEAMPARTTKELEDAFLLAQRECIRRGITCVHESAATQAEMESFAQLDTAGKLKIYINAALYGDAIEPGIKTGPTAEAKILSGQQRWRAYGIKFFMDGSLGSRSALLHQPYNDDAQNCGVQIMTQEALSQGIERALNHGFQPLVHAIGPKAFNLALAAYQKAQPNISAAAQEIRFRIEHAEVVIPQDILYAAKLGALLVIQPVHIVSDSAWLEQRLGRTVAKCAGTWNSMMKAGLRLSGGSDAPMDELSPLAGIVAASHRPEHFPEETLTRAEAIKLYTENAAYAAHQERVMGSLREGFLANFTVFDRDIRIVSHEKLLQTTVLQTVIYGRSEHSVFY